MPDDQLPPLTDPVMPEDYSSLPAPKPVDSAGKPTILAQPPKPIESANKPASPPQHGSPTTLAIPLLGLLAFTGIAATTFFYQQNRRLNQQLQTLQSIEKQRQVPEVTPPPAGGPTPTATSSASTANAFPILADVLTLARQESSTAQLLMITSDNLLPDKSTPANQTTFKYWFRRSPNLKSYFFIEYQIGGTAKLFSSANITPDNNIPDLITYYDQQTLGLDTQQAHQLAYDNLVKQASGEASLQSVAAKYLRSFPSNPNINTPINLWQLTYKFTTGAPDIVVQVDAQKQEIAFSNLPKDIPQGQ